MITYEEVTTCFEISGGKYAKVEFKRTTGTHQLVVKHSQKSASDLTVYKVPLQDKSVVMAFCFKQNKTNYRPLVERDPVTKDAIVKLSLGPINQPFDGFPEKYLFRWETNDEYGSLRSVAEPEQYLSVSQGLVITLSSEPYPGFRFKPTNLNIPANSLASRNIVLSQFSSVCSDHCTLLSHRRKRKRGKYQKSLSIHPYPCTK
ncbi:hypothetical protein AMELA_G00237530 [Ameiurus melas]|uniref:Uncharacterized protein n=1 Tax=Ameiurus melas TaxID=219545 RepID=A0A7J5ZX57_AMEME|nr:hypothetical protein AMELA_G00237530 [Ameiurus melas]